MKTSTTRRTDVTDDQIMALMTEAGDAGDLEQVGLCQRAISGSTAARDQCERVIREATAYIEIDDV